MELQPALHRFNALKVYLILVTGDAVFSSMIFTYDMVYQVQVAHLNALQLVLVGTMLEACIFLFEIPTGVLADVYSRRLSVIIGFLLIGAGFVVEGSFPIFAIILAAQFLWGLGYTFTSGATQAWIIDEVGEKLADEAIIRGSQAGKLGDLIGILIGIGLASIRVNIPVVSGGICYGLLALFLIMVMPETGFKPTPVENRNSWRHWFDTFHNGVILVKERPILLNLLGIGLFYGLYSEGFDRLWTKLILDRFSLPALGFLQPLAWFGIIRIVAVVLSIASLEFVRRRLDLDELGKLGASLWTITGFLIVGMVSFARSRFFFTTLCCYWLISVCRNLIYPLLLSLQNKFLDAEVRATVLSMASQVDAGGQISGGPLVGWIGVRLSVQAAILTSGLLLTPALALWSRLLRPLRQHELSKVPGDQEIIP